MFDFWFEYKKVIPKGFERFKGKLANLSDEGIIIHLFVGNHDLWSFGYLETELGLKIYRNPHILQINNKNIKFKYPNSNDYVFNNLSLEIERNDCIGIIGDNGSGKTTLIKVANGALKPNFGDNKLFYVVLYVLQIIVLFLANEW